jgi:anti-anti-sigma factor
MTLPGGGDGPEQVPRRPREGRYDSLRQSVFMGLWRRAVGRSADDGAGRAEMRALADEDARTGLVLSGELDMDSVACLTARLIEDVPRDGDLVVEAGGLSFIDVSGCRALVEAAERLGDGRRLVLSHPPRTLVRVMSLCGWADHPRLVLLPSGDAARAAA